MWIAKDDNGAVCLYTVKPERTDHDPYWSLRGGDYMYMEYELPPGYSWDDQPIEVELVPVNSESYEEEVIEEVIEKNKEYFENPHGDNQ